MSKLLNKVLKQFLEDRGFRIVRISRFGPALDRLYQKTSNFKFVQIGANDGVSFDSLYPFVTSHPCSGIVIEPLPDVFEKLYQNYRAHPQIIPLNVAIHRDKSEATLYRIDPDKIAQLGTPWVAGMASFSINHLQNPGITPELILEQKVRCVPLMDAIESHGMMGAQLLQIDTEGYDAEIIKMIDFSRFRPGFIKYEWVHISDKALKETKGLLRRQGYRIMKDKYDILAILSAGLRRYLPW